MRIDFKTRTSDPSSDPSRVVNPKNFSVWIRFAVFQFPSRKRDGYVLNRYPCPISGILNRIFCNSKIIFQFIILISKDRILDQGYQYCYWILRRYERYQDECGKPNTELIYVVSSRISVIITVQEEFVTTLCPVLHVSSSLSCSSSIQFWI